MADEYAELERIASTFHKSDRNDFLNYVWLTTFVYWDCLVATAEAVTRACEAESRAARVWAYTRA